MRTTLTLDSETEALLRRRMAETGASFKRVVNDAIRAGLSAEGQEREPYRLRPKALGQPMVPLNKALQFAAELEDDEITRKLAVGK
jgi:hypothetical protein